MPELDAYESEIRNAFGKGKLKSVASTAMLEAAARATAA